LRAQSDAEMSPQHLGIGLYFAGRAFVHDMTVVDDVGALRQRKRGGEILLHRHYGLPGVDELAANLHKVTYDHRRQTFERFVEQNKLASMTAPNISRFSSYA